jgi:hypothetical protein
MRLPRVAVGPAGFITEVHELARSISERYRSPPTPPLEAGSHIAG